MIGFAECSDPTNTDGLEVASLFGDCTFSAYTQADMDLTMEVQAAAAAAKFPARYSPTSVIGRDLLPGATQTSCVNAACHLDTNLAGTAQIA